MPDNQAKNGGNLSDEAILKAMAAQLQESPEEDTANVSWGGVTKDVFMEGLAFLKSIAPGRFSGYEVNSLTPGQIAFDINLEIKNESFITKHLRHVINHPGDMFTNNNDDDHDDNDNPLGSNDYYVPAPAVHKKATEAADDAVLKIKTNAQVTVEETDDAWQEAYDDYLQKVKLEEGYDADINITATPTTVRNALKEIARLAALQGVVLSVPDMMKNPTPVEAEIIQGIKDGIDQRNGELRFVKHTVAKPTIDGLEYLRALSGNTLNIAYAPATDRSEVAIKISAPATEGEKDPFCMFVKANVDGKIKIGRYKGNYEAPEFEYTDQSHINFILGSVAKTAAFAGKVPLSPDAPEAKTEGEQAVLRAVQQAGAERRLVVGFMADKVLNGLDFMEKMSGDGLNVTTTPSAHSSALLIEISAPAANAEATPFSRFISIDKNGKATLSGYKTDSGAYGSREYTARKDTDLTALFGRVARDAVTEGKVSFSRLQPDPAIAEQIKAYEAICQAEKDNSRETRLHTDVSAAKDFFAPDETGSLKHILATAIADRNRRNAEEGPRAPLPSLTPQRLEPAYNKK